MTLEEGDTEINTARRSPLELDRAWRWRIFVLSISIQETHDFVDSLESRTEEVTLVEYQHSKPDLDRATNRIDMLTRVGGFLGRHLEGARPMNPDVVSGSGRPPSNAN